METKKENILKTHIPLGISVVSLFVAVFTLVITRNTAHTSNYIEVYNFIQAEETRHSALLRKVEELKYQKAKLQYSREDTAPIEEQILEMTKDIDTSVRAVLSAYEFACYQYRNRAIDRAAFKNQYFWIIKNYAEKPPYSDELKRYAEKPRYKYYEAVMTVYNEWKPEYEAYGGN